MHPLSTAVSPAFTWTDLPRNAGTALKRHDELAGTVTRAGRYSSDYIATTPFGTWKFHRRGLMGTGVEILDSDSHECLAAYKSHWGGRGTLTFADGESFHLECHGLWHPVWKVTTMSGELVLSLHTREQFVDVPDESHIAASRLSALVMFIVSRVRQAEEDTASCAMVG